MTFDEWKEKNGKHISLFEAMIRYEAYCEYYKIKPKW